MGTIRSQILLRLYVKRHKELNLSINKEYQEVQSQQHLAHLHITHLVRLEEAALAPDCLVQCTHLHPLHQ